MEVQTTGEIITTTAEPSTPAEPAGFDMAGAVDSIGDGLGFGETVNEEVVEPADPVAAPVADPEPAPEDAAPSAPAASPAPRTWRPEALAKWGEIPPVVQAEILKREEDMFKGIEGYKVDAGFGKAMTGILQPYANIFKQYNIDPVSQVANLVQSHYKLAFGTPEEKAALHQRMIADYGLQPTGEAPYIDPQVKALQEELRTLKSGLQGVNQQRDAEIRAKLAEELDIFAKDPANSDFELVANDIAALLQAGQAGSLKEAYEKAIWLNPATRAKQIARETAAAQSAAKKVAEEKAKEVRKAIAANVNARPKSASAATPLGSMDDTLEAQLASIKARG